MNRRLVIVGVLVLVVALAGCAVSVDDSPTLEPMDTPTPETTPTPDANTPNPEGTLEIHAINVGQADATLVIAPSGETMLIDSGDWRDSGETVLAYLDAQNIDRIDHLVTTHPHADHIGGHDVLIEEFETERDGIGAVWDPGVTHTSQTYERYLDAIDEHDVTLYTTQEGDELPVETEGLTMTVLNPPAGSDEPDDAHYNSLTIHIEYGDTTALFTGDAETAAESRMVDAHRSALDADLYHAGHHGSSTSSSEPYLDAVTPAKAILSSAYDSEYGHPHDETIDALDNRDIESYWTAVHGSMVFESNGTAWTVAVQTDATTDPDTLRDEPETTVEPAVDPREGDGTARIMGALWAIPTAEVSLP